MSASGRRTLNYFVVCDTPRLFLSWIWRESSTKLRFTTNDRQSDRGAVNINAQFGSRCWVQSKIAITRENHQSNLLSLRNDLVIGLEVERHFIKLAWFKWFAFRQ